VTAAYVGFVHGPLTVYRETGLITQCKKLIRGSSLNKKHGSAGINKDPQDHTAPKSTRTPMVIARTTLAGVHTGMLPGQCLLELCESALAFQDSAK
jgi:hypothetical protein